VAMLTSICEAQLRSRLRFAGSVLTKDIRFDRISQHLLNQFCDKNDRQFTMGAVSPKIKATGYDRLVNGMK
jgi:hypothetical protein